MFLTLRENVKIDGSIRGELAFSDRAGWVLAGGRSSRMGTNKALIEIGGRPLVARAAELVAAVANPVAIVGDPKMYAELGYWVVADNFPGCGPLAGIEAALAATESEWNVIVACDMPALEAVVLEALFRSLEEPGADCAMPVLPDGSVEPLCSVFHRRCLGEVRAALSAGKRRVNGAVSAVRYVRVAHPEPFANLNTPEDLREYDERGARNA